MCLLYWIITLVDDHRLNLKVFPENAKKEKEQYFVHLLESLSSLSERALSSVLIVCSPITTDIVFAKVTLWEQSQCYGGKVNLKEVTQ